MASKPPPSLGAPAGLPPSNAKYVVVAVVLVGLIIAAVAWKKCSGPGDVPPPPVFDAGPPIKPTGRNPDDDVPLPPHWGGFILAPTIYEFWQGRQNRLHDRVRYRLAEGRWVIERLSP